MTLNLRDKRLLLLCFVSLRILLLIAYQPLAVNGTERGLTAGGDFQYYHALIDLRAQDQLPYRDFWYEFPPVFMIVGQTVSAIVGTGNYSAFAMLLALVFIAADAINLWLLLRLATRLHGTDTGYAVAWLYTVLVAPLIIGFWAFDALVIFSMLTALTFFARRPALAGLMLVIGAFTKFYPVILLAAAWRTMPPRRAMISTGVVVLGVALLIGFYLLFPRFGMASLAAQSGKASYQTVWALLDGNYRTGIFGTVADHFDPAAAGRLIGNPPVLPFVVRTAFFGVIGLALFIFTRRRDEYGLICFGTLTVIVFFLWSQGWSPQWLAILIPLMLICLPTRTTALMVLLLSGVVLAEYPYLFVRTGDTGGVISAAQLPIFTALILIRTVLLVLFAAQLFAKLRFVRAWDQL